jgi:hypothetical protein
MPTYISLLTYTQQGVSQDDASARRTGKCADADTAGVQRGGIPEDRERAALSRQEPAVSVDGGPRGSVPPTAPTCSTEPRCSLRETFHRAQSGSAHALTAARCRRWRM